MSVYTRLNFDGLLVEEEARINMRVYTLRTKKPIECRIQSSAVREAQQKRADCDCNWEGLSMAGRRLEGSNKDDFGKTHVIRQRKQEHIKVVNDKKKN